MKYSEILAENKRLEGEVDGNDFKISILSNIIANQLKEVVEFSLRSEGMNAVVEFGNYDNIVQDSALKTDSKITVIFWELANLTDGLEYRAPIMDHTGIENLMQKLKGEIQLC